MSEVSKQFLERISDGEIEQVEGGEGAFDPEDYEDEPDDEEDAGEFEES